MRQTHAQPLSALLWGVVPSLLGWVSLLLNDTQGVLLMAVLLWVCLIVDRTLYSSYRLQAWLAMHFWLTLVSSSSCLVAALAWSRQVSQGTRGAQTPYPPGIASGWQAINRRITDDLRST